MEKRDDTIDNVIDESTTSVAGAAKAANRVVKDTAQSYLNTVGINVDLQDFEERLRDRAFLSLGIAAGAGFVLGGGLATKVGVMLLGLFGRAIARQTVTNAGRQVLQKAGSQA
ncbi:MAG: hypothetical protein JO033_27590 [Acidobacteriaceae bacterium]|nr:hypothetical protein [Acidobacteriota bacterium]MBV8812452.1 hypothetical protein [Acidobacteriaceae bacterium]MBV9498642.1 hypothetical protein [Acidobacteriaceae bacterium]